MENKVTSNKMEQEVQVQQEQQVATRENQVKRVQQEQRVTTKDPKKVEAGKRLAAHNHKKREELKVQKSEVSQYYGIGAVLAVGVIGGLGYYIYQSKKGEVSIVPHHHHQPPQQPPQTNKFEME